ncbi:MAG: helix-hairpin-helix domain-containing protein [Saprospiraceae bacterium]
MLQQLIRQFHFTKAERHGAVALLCLAGLGFLAPVVYRQTYRPIPPDHSDFKKQVQRFKAAASSTNATSVATMFEFDPNTASVELFVQLGLREKVAQTIVKYRTRGGRFRTPEDLQKIYTLPEADFERLRPYVRIKSNSQPTAPRWQPKQVAQLQPFTFDPNTASEAELLRLGLPQALVTRLLRYREKGGYFFEKTDFRKLYGLREPDYQRLEPYIVIARADKPIRPATYAGGAGKANPLEVLDINTAPATAWQQLPGIGAYRAQQIVRFREKLGGFVSPAQVAETRGLPDSIFQKIQGLLRLETPPFRTLNLNTATVEEFNAHPYFSFKQGQLIVAYREQHGPFARIQDLGKIAAFTDHAWLNRVAAYLTVE